MGKLFGHNTVAADFTVLEFSEYRFACILCGVGHWREFRSQFNQTFDDGCQYLDSASFPKPLPTGYFLFSLP